MIYCDTCLHKEVCGLEGNNEPAIQYCADRLEKQTNTAEWKEKFKQEIEIANKDIDLMPEQEDYMRGYLGGILCSYRIVFGKNYEESEDIE